MNKKRLLYSLLLAGTVGVIGCADTAEEAEEAEDATEESSEAVSETESESETNTENDTDSEIELVHDSNETEAQYTTEVNQELLDEHEARDQEIQEEFQAGDYTLESPLVIQDPYGRAPLTALLLFETPEPMEITVTVEGQTEDADISHTYEGFETQHEAPVLGLYPEYANQITLSGESENGDTSDIDLVMETGSLPDGLLDFTVETAQPEMMEEGLTFVSPSRDSYPAGVDSNGDVRWYSALQSSHQFKRLDNGNVLMATLEEDREDYDTLTEMDMLGRVYQSIAINMENVIASAPLHHDTIELSNGNYLALLHDGSDEYVEDEMAEIDRETGEVVHRINFKDVFPAEMYEDYEGHQADVGDWLHANAVWEIEDEDALLISARQYSLPFKITYPEGEVEWILAYPEEWNEELDDYLLEPVGEDFKYPSAQHAIMEMPDQDGNEETLDIMLYDNNRVYTHGYDELSGEFSRAVQYRVNEEEDTVEEIWSYGEERGPEFYSDIVGDADFLPDSENVLITSGRALNEEEEQRYSIITEVTRTEDPEVVYELHYGPFGADEYLQIYRSERMPLYPEN